MSTNIQIGINQIDARDMAESQKASNTGRSNQAADMMEGVLNMALNPMSMVSDILGGVLGKAGGGGGVMGMLGGK